MNVPAKYRNAIYIATVAFAAIAGVAAIFGLVDPSAIEEGNKIAGQLVEFIQTMTMAFALIAGVLARKNLTPDE